jgi:MFS family permease
MKAQKLTSHAYLAWIVTLTAALFFFYEFIQLILPNAINVKLMQAFNLDAPGLGWLASMYFFANALFLFPAGNLLDRYSTKKLLLGAVALCTLGTFLFGIAQHVALAAVGRFIVGIGAAFCFLSCIRIASRWFPPSRMALVTGVVVTMAMLGGFVAQTPMVLLTQWVGWRNAILLDAALGIVVALAIIFIVQDRPPNSHEDHQADKAKLQDLGFLRCIKLVLLNPNNWLGGIYTSLLNLPVFILGGLWGMRYLVQVHHLTELQASYATSMLFVGVIFGSPAFGWFSDHIGRRCLPMIIGAIASLLVMLILMYTPNLSQTSLNILFFLIGFVTSSQVLSYPAIAELNPIALTGTAVSVASVTIMCSGNIFLPLFGWLLEFSGDKSIIDNTPVYTLQDFNLAMWIMPISFIVGIVIAFLIRETYCESQVH